MGVKIPYVVVNGKTYIREDEVLDAIIDIAGFARVESSERYNNLIMDLIRIDCEESVRRQAEDAKKTHTVGLP